MRPIEKDYTVQTVSTTVLAAAQTTAGAGSFTMAATAPTDGLAHKVTLTSTGNISGVTFTITGSYSGRTVTETLAGPNNNTVTSANYYDSNIAISVDGAVGTNTSAGISAVSVSPILIGEYLAVNSIASVNVTGTINYTVQFTNDRNDCFNFSALPTFQSHTDTAVVSATASASAVATGPIVAYRLLINSYSSGATIKGRFVWSEAN